MFLKRILPASLPALLLVLHLASCGQSSSLGMPVQPSSTQTTSSTTVAGSGTASTGDSSSQDNSPKAPPICPFNCAEDTACSAHGGANCMKGPDQEDGSVVCMDGFTDDPSVYQCQVPKGPVEVPKPSYIPDDAVPSSSATP